MRLRRLLLPILLFYSLNLVAQDLSTTKFGLNSPLKTSTIYDVYCAKDGMIYIGTNNGFWSYDGINFRNYKSKGLLVKNATCIQENMQGHIFFQNFTGTIFCWNGDSLTVYKTQQELGFLAKNFLIINDYTYYWNATQLVYQQEQDTVHTKINLEASKFGAIIPHRYTSNGLLYSSNNKKNRILKLDKGTIYSLDTIAQKNNPSHFLADYKNDFLVRHHNGDTDILINSKKEVVFDLAKSPKALNPRVLVPIGKHVFLGTKEGLYFPLQNKLFLKDHFIADICTDQENNIWVATTNRGLLKIHHLEMRLYYTSGLKNRSDFILKHDSSLIISDMQGNLFHWDNKKEKFHSFFQQPNPALTKNIFFDSYTNQYIHSGSSIILFDRDYSINRIKVAAAPTITPSSFDNQVYSYRNNYISWHLSSIMFETKNKTTRVYPLFKHYSYGEKGALLNQVFIHDGKSCTKYKDWIIALRQDTLTFIHDENMDSIHHHSIPPNSMRVSVYNKRIWLRYENQLIEYDEYGNQLNVLNQANGLKEPYNHISVNDNYIALTGRTGVYIYDAKTMEQLHKFTTDNGIASLDFEQSWIYDNTLYVNGSRGVSVFPLDINYSKGNPRLWIKKILANRTPFKDSILPHTQNNIQLEFAVRSFTTKGKLYWRLNSKKWKELEGKKSQVSLEALQYGSYKIEAYFENDLGTKTPTISYNFEVKPPYWHTWWFYSLINLGIGLIAFFFWRRRQQENLKEEQRQNEFNLLKLQALQTQMNPHFIFNVQAAIQGLWLESKEEIALSFQTHFSKMLRQIFQYSSQRSISVDQMIEFLEHYVALEKIRFEENVDILWEIDPLFEQEDYFVPPLLIQPIIENAFKHGLLHKKGDKQIIIKLQHQDKYLHCIVTDNGVGRRSSSSKNNKRASGLETTKSRLNILQVTLIKKAHPYQNILITDLTDKLDHPIGTKVELWIPFVDFL